MASLVRDGSVILLLLDPLEEPQPAQVIQANAWKPSETLAVDLAVRVLHRSERTWDRGATLAKRYIDNSILAL